MTCIAGLVHDGKAYIGADSAGVSGWDLTLRSDAKVFRNGPYVIGITTSFRMGDLLHYAFKPPSPPAADWGLRRFMVTEFVDAVRDCLKAGGFAQKDKEKEEGGSFLVGVKGHLFEIGSDYQVGEPLDGISAVGCGARLALGALWVLRESPDLPYDRLMMALDAAERFSNGVRAPFVVEHE